MKKFLIYSWLPCLLAMFMCTTFTACSDDDDSIGSGGNVIGRWTYVLEDGETEFYEFKENGELIFEYHFERGDGSIGKSQDTFHYETIDGLLYKYYNQNEYSIYKYYVKGDKLYMAEIGWREADGSIGHTEEEYYECYKRVE